MGITGACAGVVASVAAALFGGLPGSSAADAAVVAAAPVDIELAIDGTGSMSTAIERAKSEGVRALVGVKSLLPNSRFAVVVFRDQGNPAGEYQLLQPLTSDQKAVEQALRRVTARANTSPGNTPAESYNLAFRRSYSDAKIGWNTAARKIVVVVGDAEPNGAGAEHLPGCRDTSRDPHGLSTRQELASMRAARRTLIMIRAQSAALTASLDCYASLAARAFIGGAARDAGADIATLIVNLIKRAYLPLTIRNDLRAALRNSRTGYTITLPNPSSTSLKVRSLRFELPAGFRYLRSSVNRAGSSGPSQTGRVLSWTLDTSLTPNAKLRVYVVVRTPARVGAYRSIGSATVVTADGRELVAQASPAVVRVKRRLRALTLRLVPRTARGSTTVSGQGRFRFGRQWRGLPAPAAGYGRITVKEGAKRVVLQAVRLRLDSLAAPTRTRLLVRVEASRGYRRCGTGTRGTLIVTESAEAAQPDRAGRIVGRLVPGCGGGFIAKATVVAAVR